MNEVGVDPGIDHMLAMECFDDVKEHGGKVTHHCVCVVCRATVWYSCFFRGFAKKKKFQKSEITMEVGGRVQVSLGFFCFWKIVPK